MSEELKITKERVLSAAGKCGTAKEVLKELFPEVFGEEWEDVTGQAYFEYWGTTRELLLCVEDRPEDRGTPRGHRSCLSIKEAYPTPGGESNKLKIEKGKIWRRKSR